MDSLLCVCVSPACVLRSVFDDEEVDDPGGEVQSDLRLAVDDGDAVPVAVAGSGHPAAEQQERGPGRTRTHGHTHTHVHTEGQVQFSLVYLQINV